MSVTFHFDRGEVNMANTNAYRFLIWMGFDNEEIDQLIDGDPYLASWFGVMLHERLFACDAGRADDDGIADVSYQSPFGSVTWCGIPPGYLEEHMRVMARLYNGSIRFS